MQAQTAEKFKLSSAMVDKTRRPFWGNTENNREWSTSSLQMPKITNPLLKRSAACKTPKRRPCVLTNPLVAAKTHAALSQSNPSEGARLARGSLRCKPMTSMWLAHLRQSMLTTRLTRTDSRSGQNPRLNAHEIIHSYCSTMKNCLSTFYFYLFKVL